MYRSITLSVAVAALTLAILPLDAAAQTYRCTSKEGKVYYGQTIPTPCIGQIVEQLNSQGLVMRRIMPTNAQPEEDPAAKEAEEKKKREEAAHAKEEARRNRALLATYTSAQEIDDARARALAEPTRRVAEIEARVEELKKKQAALAKEKAAYTKSKRAPSSLEEQLHNLGSELSLQLELLASKRRDIESINTRYDEDRKRYIELTRRR
jgi:DNA repair exonuclease SbcCD ATPase subunit